MKWLRITAVFVLMTLVKSGPTRNEAPVPESTTISQIDRIEAGDFKFTFLKSPTIVPKQYMLEVYTAGGKETPVPAEEVGIQPFVTFKTNLETYSGSEAYFLITSLNDDIETIGFADAKLSMFPIFPVDLTSTLISKVGGVPDGKLLRVKGNMEKMTIEDGTCVSNGDIKYCSFPSGVAKYVPCDETNGIPVCDKDLQPTNKEAATGNLKSVILSYNDENSATITLSFDVDPTPITIRDVIINLSDSGKNVLFTDSEECIITETFPSLGTYNILILKSPGDDTWTTNSVDIKDRELYATILGDDIIEGRWRILGVESTGASTTETPAYLLSLTKDGGTDPVDSIAVDCSNLETYCFGYFPIQIAKAVKYTLIVAHQTDATNPTYDELRQVESIPQEKPALSEPELAILSRHTTRHANQLMADVNICFEHLTPTEGRSFSHYEMLIINEKGQWLKHKILEEEKEREGRLCFTPFPINTIDFDLTEGTKVIVSQRGVDGFTVLATGQSKLL